MAITGVVAIVSELRAERTNLGSQLKHIDAALSVLGKLNGGSSYTKPRHTLSAAARKKISMAQKARWAKQASSNGVVAVKPKRTMSPAACYVRCGRQSLRNDRRRRYRC
jgi:hypothetical protein